MLVVIYGRRVSEIVRMQPNSMNRVGIVQRIKNLDKFAVFISRNSIYWSSSILAWLSKTLSQLVENQINENVSIVSDEHKIIQCIDRQISCYCHRRERVRNSVTDAAMYDVPFGNLRNFNSSSIQ